jgi:uncharacterized membrane protein YesL
MKRIKEASSELWQNFIVSSSIAFTVSTKSFVSGNSCDNWIVTFHALDYVQSVIPEFISASNFAVDLESVTCLKMTITLFTITPHNLSASYIVIVVCAWTTAILPILIELFRGSSI